ncbi:hypothetical protein JL721_2517 [Aureococcus anophagefferens]|nr:hypothetical protein JL721_2517 [Aureococcus anophagefferens]
MGCGYDWTQEDDGLFGAKHIEEKPLKARPSKKLRKGSKRRKKRKDSDAAPAKIFHGLAATPGIFADLAPPPPPRHSSTLTATPPSSESEDAAPEARRHAREEPGAAPGKKPWRKRLFSWTLFKKPAPAPSEGPDAPAKIFHGLAATPGIFADLASAPLPRNTPTLPAAPLVSEPEDAAPEEPGEQPGAAPGKKPWRLFSWTPYRKVFSPLEQKALEDLFRRLDTDGSGALSYGEVAESLVSTSISPQNIAKMIKEADADGDGEVDLDEFVEMMKNAKTTKSLWDLVKSPPAEISERDREQLVAEFRKADADGSGSLDLEELEAVLSGTKLTRKQIRKMMADADADGDGELDEDEFVAMMDAVADKPAKPGVVRRMLSGGLPSLSKEVTWPGADNEKRHSAENNKAARVKEAIAVL